MTSTHRVRAGKATRSDAAGALVPLLILILIGAACRQATFEPPSRPQHPLLEKLDPPPTNLPARGSPRSPRAADPQTPAALLPPGNRPALLVAVNGRMARGPLKLSGRVATDTDRLEFVAENQPPIQIQYRLPPPLKLPAVKAPGTLLFVDRTNAGGPARQLVVTARGAPLLAEFWLKSPEPITMDLGQGLRLKQRTGPPEGIHDIVLEVVDETQHAQPLALRAPATIKTGVGVFQTFVEASYLVNVSDPTGQSVGGYIAHVWIARSSP